MPRPSFSHERSHEAPVAGIDEAGRGPWAGPVVAAAVILHKRTAVRGLQDSKLLTKPKREALYLRLMDHAECTVGVADVQEIDTLNILGATKLAMQRAAAALQTQAATFLVDGNQPPVLAMRTIAIIGGDGRSLSIAAASIIAKVTRDRMMAELHEHHPHYGFAQHAGYGTKAHQRALAEHGPCVAHRKSFAPIRILLEARTA